MIVEKNPAPVDPKPSAGPKAAEPKPTPMQLPGGETVQPKKRGPKGPRKQKPAATTQSETSLSVDQLADTVKPILYAGFGIVASRLGEHWQLTDQEADSISQPTARILKRFESIEFIEKYADYIALTVALGTAVGGRVMLQKQMGNKEVTGKNGESGPKLAAVPKPDTQREINRSGEPTPPANTANVSSSIKESIPSMAL